MQLIGDLLKAYDRSGDELREHRNVTRVVDEVADDLGVAAVDVDHVAHRLEGVETDPERQYDAEKSGELRGGYSQRRDEGVIIFDPEVEVFEETEDREVAYDRDGDEELFALRETFHQPSVGVVDGGVEEHQYAEIRIRPAVEEVAKQRQHRMFTFSRCEVVPRQHRRQKEKQKQI